MDYSKSTAKTSPLQAKISHSIQWHDIAEAVALRQLEEPNHKLSNHKFFRWVNKGSKLLDRATEGGEDHTGCNATVVKAARRPSTQPRELPWRACGKRRSGWSIPRRWLRA